MVSVKSSAVTMATGGRVQSVGGTKIMVNNLPNYFTEEEFKSMFGRYGEIQFIRLCRHKVTNKSLGYGFIDFVKAVDAARAIEEVHGLQLGDKKLRVAYPEPVGDDVKNATKVTFKKLPQRYNEEELKEMCGKYGRIVKVRILRDSVTNKSKTVGFVFFERWADATRAVAGLNGSKPENAKQSLDVKIEQNDLAPRQSPAQQARPYTQPRPHSQGGSVPAGNFKQIPSYVSNPKSSSNVFLYNIGEYIGEQEIYNIFAQFGGLLKIDIVRDPATKLCKGYAFLTFESKGSAENAIFTMDGMFYRGRQLQVRYKHS